MTELLYEIVKRIVGDRSGFEILPLSANSLWVQSDRVTFRITVHQGQLLGEILTWRPPPPAGLAVALADPDSVQLVEQHLVQHIEKALS